MEAMLIVDIGDDDFAQYPVPVTPDGYPILPRDDDIIKTAVGHCKVNQILWDYVEQKVYVFADPLPSIEQVIPHNEESG